MGEFEEKSPAFQWYVKQLLGDDKVLAMDWDAVGMHVWLLNMSWQQEPKGSIPDDVGVIRRWLRLPSGFADADRVWARVWPQINAAWALKDGRWFNAGMVRAAKRQQIYKQNGSKNRAKCRGKPKQLAEDEEIDLKEKKGHEPKMFDPDCLSEPPPEMGVDELTLRLLLAIGIGRSPKTINAMSEALRLKSTQANWTVAKAYLHILQMALDFKGSALFKGEVKGFSPPWEMWLIDGWYDRPEKWRTLVSMKDNGLKPLPEKFFNQRD